MGIFGDVFGGLGDIAGLFSGGGADKDKGKYYQQLIDKMSAVDPNITYDSGAQDDVLRELQQTYRSGGLDPIARSQMAEATAGANRNAQANRNAVVEGARARGMGNSGVTTALQEQGGQGAMQDANMAATGAAATAEGNRARALSAADAVNRFNESMKTGVQQQTFGNKMGQIQGEGDLYGGIYGANKAGEDRTARLWGSLGRVAGSAGDAVANGGGGVPSWMKTDPFAGASYT